MKSLRSLPIWSLLSPSFRAVRGLLLALAAAVPLMSPAPAAAQGTSGSLPDPISTRELMEYGDRLGLSDQQRQALEGMHDQYKEQFRVLREGEISVFLKEMRDLNSGGVMPRKEDVEKFFDKMNALTNKIELLDNRLLDQAQTVLSDEQMARMPRVRLARERERHSGQQMMFGMTGPIVDLSKPFMELELSGEQLELADPLMAQYETRITGQIVKLHDATTGMFKDLFDALEKAGFTEQSMEDPEVAGKMMETMQGIWRDLSRKSMEAAAEARELNRRTYKSVAAVLPAEAAHTFRDRFYREAYPEAGFAMEDTDAMLKTALRSEKLDDSQREQLQVVFDDFTQRMDKLLEAAVDEIDAFRRDMSPMDFSGEHHQEHNKRMEKLQAEATQVRESAMETVKNLLGEERFAAISAQMMEEANKTDDAQSQAMAAAEAEREAQEAEADFSPGPDQYLPPQIGDRELTDYAQRLKLPEDQRPVLDGLHVDYADQFKAVQDNEIKAVTEAVQRMWQHDPETGASSGPTPQTSADVHRLRKAALDAIRRVDDAFFNRIQEVLLTDDQTDLMKRVRLARERQIYNRSSHMGFFGSSNESTIDLDRLLRRARLDEAALQAADPALAGYEQAVTAAYKDRYEATLEFQEAQDQWSAGFVKAQSEGDGAAASYAAKWQEVVGQAQRKLGQANQAIGKLNRETLAQLISSLPTEQGREVRSAYNRRAYPEVYNDTASIERPLASAQGLTDLTPEQQSKLADLAAEYRPAYEQFCEQMVSATPTTNPWESEAAQQDWQDWQAKREAVSKMRFDRDELSQRARRKLRAILTPEQVERIGGLPEPKPQERNPWD